MTKKRRVWILKRWKVLACARMDYLGLLCMLFIGVCMISGLNMLADIATSLRAQQRRESTAGIVAALDRIRLEIEKSARTLSVLGKYDHVHSS